MTWAHEAWKLSTAVAKKIRSWNARKLPKISGRTVEAEYKKPTFQLVDNVEGPPAALARISPARIVG